MEAQQVRGKQGQHNGDGNAESATRHQRSHGDE